MQQLSCQLSCFFPFTSGNTNKTIINFNSLKKDKVVVVENIDFKGKKTTTTDDLQGTKNTIIISILGLFLVLLIALQKQSQMLTS